MLEQAPAHEWKRPTVPADRETAVPPSREPPVMLRWLLPVTAAWTISALISAAQLQTMRATVGEPLSWLGALVPALTSSYLWIPLTLLAFWSAARFPIERGDLLRPLLVHTAGGLFAVVTRGLAVIMLNRWIGWYSELPSLPQLFITSLNNNLIVYWLLVGAGHAVHYAQATHEQQKLLVESQLLVLKSQLQPHFLFNTLNTISAYVHTDPAVAERMLDRLGRLLRHSLEAGTVHEVTLSEELAALQPYIEIEMTRFEDRLTVTHHVDDGVLLTCVPHLLLQPLVENAIRHGIAPRAAPGTIAISARREGDDVVIEVSDDGLGLRADSRLDGGVGLRNTRDRLAHLYGPGERLTLLSGPSGGARAVVRLPFRRGSCDE